LQFDTALIGCGGRLAVERYGLAAVRIDEEEFLFDAQRGMAHDASGR
jgi:hypothetical protein